MKSGIKICPKCKKKQLVTKIITDCCGEMSQWESTILKSKKWRK